MMERLKKMFYQKYEDYELGGHVDPREFHDMVFLYFKLFRVSDEPLPRWTIYLLVITFMSGSTGVFCAILSTYHGITQKELMAFAEPFAYLLVLAYQVQIVMTALLNRDDYQVLIRVMIEDFKYACDKGGKYRKQFLENQVITNNVAVVLRAVMVLSDLALLLFVWGTLAVYMITHTPGDGQERPFLVPYWIPNVDVKQSPIYEILFGHTVYCISLYNYTYLFMMQTQIIWIREITTKVDMLVLCLEDLLNEVRPPTTVQEKLYYDRLVRERMREIIQQHHSINILIDHYSSVYKKMLLIEQKLVAPVVSVTSYCVLKRYSDGEFNGVLAAISSVVLTISFVPNYLCTFLSEKVTSVSLVCLHNPFWNAGPVIRPYLVLLVERSLRPMPMTSCGFKEVSMETYGTCILTMTYSYFNMLKQVDI